MPICITSCELFVLLYVGQISQNLQNAFAKTETKEVGLD